MYLVSFIIGLIIVISSIFLMRQELNRAIRNQKSMLEQSRVYKDEDLFALLDSLQLSIDEMNRAFYDIAGDLEGKYSIHERELRLLNETVQALRTKSASDSKDTLRTNAKASIDSMKMSATENINDPNVQQPSEPSEALLLDRVIVMRSEGKTLTQIAKELGIGMGELQLLLTIKK